MSEKPLTAAMDNVLAYRLGEITRNAARENAGDFIDTGLALRRLLEKNGFALILIKKIKCEECSGHGRHCLGGRSAHPSNWYDCEKCNGSGFLANRSRRLSRE